MMPSYSPTNVFKQCATCEFWAGTREMRSGYFRKTAEVDENAEGICLNEDSVFSQHQQPAAAGCSRWKIWSAIGPP
jgi:hypothetical protein